MERHTFVVKDEQSEMRIDLFLATMMPTLSRRKIRGILDVGGCYVNNKRMHIASRQVRGGDKVRVEFSLQALSKVKQKKFELDDKDMIFDEQYVLAMNKPPGLPSQATRDQDVMHAEVCVRSWLKKHNRTVGTLILLHRLDKETSGILLFATNPNTATWINDQFKHRKLSKTYWALCYGIPKKERFEVDCFLSEIDKRTGNVSVVHSGGKPSKTEFVVKATNQELGLCFIECYPETGRSHQIRVHLEHAGFPILGDKRYGLNLRKSHRLSPEIEGEAAKHHMLHARKITFSPAPNAKDVDIESTPPESFTTCLRLITNA